MFRLMILCFYNTCVEVDVMLENIGRATSYEGHSLLWDASFIHKGYLGGGMLKVKPKLLYFQLLESRSCNLCSTLSN